MMRFTCECGKEMQARAEYAGRMTKCPACGSQVPIPEAEEADDKEHQSTAPTRIRADRPALKRLPVEKLEEVDDEEEDFDTPARRRKNRNIRRRSRPVWIWIAASAALLLLLVGGGIGAWLFFRGGSASDLALIPGNAQGFVSVRLADVWKHEGIQKSLQQVRAQVPDFPDLDAESEKEFGMVPADVERFSWVFQDAEREVMWGIVLTNKPINKTKLLEKIGNPAEVKQGKGGYFLSAKGDKLALAFLNDKLMLFGPEAGVKFALDYEAGKPASGPLDGALKLANAKHHIVGGFNPPSKLVQQLRTSIPPQAQQYLVLTEMQSATLTIDYADMATMDIAVSFPNDAKAREAKTAVVSALDQFKQSLPQIKGMMPPEMQQAFTQAEATLNGIKIEQQGTAVALSMKSPIETAGLAGLTLPAVQKVRGASGRMVNTNNLKQLAIAMLNYASANQGRLPPAVIYSKDGKPLYSWRVALLPYLEQDQLYRQFHLDEPWDSDHNKKLLPLMPKVFTLPGQDQPGQSETCYQVFTGPGTPFNGRQQAQMPGSFTDGTSNTGLIFEAAKAVPWTSPQDLPYTAPARGRAVPSLRHLLGGHFGNTFHVAMADGTVVAVSKNVRDQTLHLAINPADGQPLPADWRAPP
jgi:hypothetical protein